MANHVVHLSVSINRSVDDTYNFLSEPRNFSKWAPGFCLSIEETTTDNTWKIQTSNGEAYATFVEKNKLGVVDHYVTMDKVTVYIPLRVLANGSGSEVVFSLFKQPNMSDADLEKDKAAVEKDLQSLKALLEK